ncbi:MAG: hypothetical protein LBE13_17965, partial [Bacteroidales bacterium]|nr:hypothetical protein [Bacteroidales bacterium]
MGVRIPLEVLINDKMKQVYIIFIIALFMLCSLSIYAQKDTRGTEFWLAFGWNARHSYDSVNLQVRIASGNQATTGNIYFTHLNDSVPFS